MNGKNFDFFDFLLQKIVKVFINRMNISIAFVTERQVLKRQ
jgi:hypothetical protein